MYVSYQRQGSKKGEKIKEEKGEKNNKNILKSTKKLSNTKDPSS
jgi:hypothetical protein